jgi:predicted enzyme related to lactoylglutathione lyase
MSDIVCWTDIPVLELDRAIKFYSTVLGQPVLLEAGPGFDYALLPHTESGVSGCLYKSEGEYPSLSGPLVYFSVEGRLDASIDAVTPNGGKILESKHPIGPHGYRAVVVDSEGNRIALHSQVP